MNLSHAQPQLVEKGVVRLERLDMVTVAIVPFGAQAIHSSVHHKQAGNPMFSPCRPSLMTTEYL